MARLSGLQREVLSLYRQCLREVRRKPVETRKNFQAYARRVLRFRDIHWKPAPANLSTTHRGQFQKYRHINKKDFTAVEYLLRKGRRQLEMYSAPGIRNIR